LIARCENNTVILKIKDGGYFDEDGVKNGIVIDPFKFYVPRFYVPPPELKGRYGVLHVYDSKGNKLFDVKVEVNKGNLSYLAFVDSDNLPNTPAKFPFQLVTFRVEGLNRGDEVNVKITYPSLENLTKNGFVQYYKFDLKNLSWKGLIARCENNTVILKIKDGGYFDEDGVKNGIVEDDGGISEVFNWFVNGNGDVKYLEDEKIVRINLTQNDNGQVTSAWFYRKVNLSKSFEIRFKVYLGNDNGGADGVTFVLQNDSRGFQALGYAGGSLGYSGISPSVAVEFDTWQNTNYNDPSDDHIAILVNGSLNHTENSRNYGTPDPVELGNVEDGNEHDVWIYWFANNNTLKVYFDGSEKISWSYDIVNRIFGGNPEVFFGFTGATGGAKNYQYVKPYVVRTFEIKIKTIRGRVLEDFGVLGVEDGSDVGIPNVTVGLFKDLNDDGKPEQSELVSVTKTNETGYYEFTIDDVFATYFVVVNSRTVNTTRGLNDGYTINDIWAEQTYVLEGDVLLNASNWTSNGDASVKPDKIILTPYENNKRGSAWLNQKIDLSKDFVIKFKAYLGDSDGGADGITFTIHNDSRGLNTLSYEDGGTSLGYQGIYPSIAIEFDTYDSGEFDPTLDHVAIDVNGCIDHTENGRNYGTPDPVELGNVEDGNEHDVWIYWFANNNTLKVYFDGELKLNWTKDIVNEIFNGNSNVFVGFTGATGGLKNLQYVYPYYMKNGDHLILNFSYKHRTKFGGENPEVSDDWSAGIYEHYATVNIPTYNGESIDFGFSFDVVVNAKDTDDDLSNPRYAQGTLRQFIINSNAINGSDRSYFVMIVPPNSQDSNGKWWTITVNSSLGALPAIEDSNTELNGTVFYPNMSVRDENSGYITYDYSNQTLRSFDTQLDIPVGIGMDGIPFSGDEAKLKATVRYLLFHLNSRVCIIALMVKA
jgi:hypothetical protein